MEDLEELAESDTLTNFDDLARALLTDPDPQIRILAIRLLWECENARLVPIFLNILDKDKVQEVRSAAATGLGLFIYLGELGKIPEELQHEIEARLFKVHSTAKDGLLRRRALESLGFSSRDEVGPLIEAAYREKDPDWVVSAVCAMGRSSDDRWKKQVLSQLLSPNEDVRSEAIHAAGELELASARKIMLVQLEDEEDVELRRELIWSLSKIGGEGVRDRLEELMDIETDDDETEFLEEAMDNLSFTEDMNRFDMFGLNPVDDLFEEETDLEDDPDQRGN
jgi:HEAT repeat protein